MNKLRYKLVFSQRLGMLVPIAEIAKSHQTGSSSTVIFDTSSAKDKSETQPKPLWRVAFGYAALMLSGVLSVQPFSAFADNTVPLNGTIVSGAGVINAPVVINNINTLNINTSTPTAVIRWDGGFNVGRNAAVNFAMPNASSSVLNRDMGGLPSQIYGSINSNGHVYIVNTNGIYFGNGAQINVGSLTATTLDDINSSSIENIYNNGILSAPTNPVFSFAGAVGSIEVAQGANIQTTSNGRVMLLAPDVTNSGVINTPDGQTLLAAGKTIYLAKANENIMVEVSAGGTAKNLGEIFVGNGHASLVGLAVNQEGVITATTSVRNNGEILLKAKQIQSLITPESDRYGTVTIAKGSKTQVLVDVKNTELAKVAQDVGKNNQSIVNIQGKDIHIEGSITANAGKVNVTGIDLVGGQSKIYLGDEAKVDVSGVNANAPMSRNQLALQLFSEQLKDSPILRGGNLFGKTIYLDAREGTSIISQSVIEQAKLSQDQTIAEAMTNGGTVTFTADDVISKSASTVNTSGGVTTYAAGNIRESKLLLNGKWIRASEAKAGVPYEGIDSDDKQSNVYSVSNARWGTKTVWSLASDVTGAGDYRAGYTQGGNAGAYTVNARNLALQGKVLANTVVGTFQRGDVANVSTPLGGAININYIGTGALNFVSQLSNPLDDTFTATSGLSDAQKATSEISTKWLNTGNSRLAVNSNGQVNVNDALNVNAKGSVAIDANAGLNINANIKVAGGNVNLSAGDRADVVLADNVTVSTSGFLTNDVPGVAGAMTGLIVKDAGNITVQNGLVMGSGAKLEANAGAWLNQNRSLEVGHGGDITVTLAQNIIEPEAFSSYGIFANRQTSAGGKLTINLQGEGATSNVKDIAIGGVNQNLANTLWIDEGFFSRGGFSSYSLSNEGRIDGDVVIGDLSSTTFIQPKQDAKVLNINYLSTSTGADISQVSRITSLPSFTRNPTSLSIRAGDDLTLHTGASIVTESPTSVTGARGNVALSSHGQMTILGDISAPAADISLTLLKTEGDSIRPNGRFDPTLSLYIGENANLSAKGHYIVPPTADGNLRSAQVADAGNINIATENGVLILKEGSHLDVSAVSGAVDLPTTIGFLRQQVDGNAGVINLAARDGMALDGTLKGQASGKGAAGTLNLNLGTDFPLSGTEGDTNNPLFFTAGQRLLTVTQQLKTLSDNNTPGSLTSNLIDTSAPQRPLTNAIGKGQISAKQIIDGGFDHVALRVDNVVENSNSGIVFEKDLILNVPVSLTLDASSFSGAATINTSALVITNNNASTLSNPSLGSGALHLNADFIDVIGNVAFTDINELQLKSANDIRLGGLRSRSSSSGSLITPQKLVMDAAQIYPVTSHAFNITPTGTNTVIEVKNSTQARSQVPLSAQGKLTLTADVIDQAGTLRAPLGEINLNAKETLLLGKNSLTSVSAENSLIPYLVTSLGGSRLVPDKSSTQSDALPYSGKKVLLNAKNVNMQEGATVDISGGGDMLAYEWIQGIGGSVDVLNQAGYYAVMPGLGNQYAPYDFNMQSASNVTLGQAIYLSGGNGLAAGKYTLLPAHYALMPGAYLVKVNGTQTPINTSLAQLDGGSLMSGYFTRLDDSNRGQFNSFSVYNGNIFTNNAGTKDYKGPAEYLLTYLNDFYSKQANTNNTSLTLPKDAGQLSIQALNQLALNGKITGQAVKGGRGALVDISSNRIQVVSTPGATTAGVLTLSADQLSKIEADSVLLGGSRTVKGNQQTVTTNASEVTFSNDADHGVVMKELLVTAKNEIRLEDGASVKTTERTSNNAGVSELQTDGAGAFLAISSVNDLEFDRNNATTASGNMVVGSGANLEASRSAVLDASQRLSLNGDIRVGEGGSLTLGTNRFLLGDNIPAVDGTRLDQQTLLAFGDLSTLNLNSYQNIDIYGAVSLGSDQLNLTLNTSGLAHHGDGDVQISANTLTLKNTQDGSVFNVPADAGTSTLMLSTKNTVLGGTQSVKGNQQRFDIQGFETVNINAQEAITTARTGQVEVKANQTELSAAKITAETGSNYVINASGSLVTSSNGNTLAETTGIGGKLSLTAAQTTINNTVELLAGQLNATSTNGDLKLGANGKIITHSATVQFDKTHAKTTDAGDVSLSSNTGNVDVAQNALIDVSGGSQQGEAGRLTVNAKNGEFLVADGALKGSASANERNGEFKLDVKSLGNFSAVNKALETGQFNQSRDIRVRTGDVNIQTGDTVTAKNFILGVDAGDANIAGTINADGNKGGNVEIYANGLVKLANTAKITARGQQTNQSTGDMETGSGGDVLLSSNSLSTTNAVSAEDGALIDVSGYDKVVNNNAGVDGADGSVTLRGRRGTTGTENTVNVAFNTTGAIKGASEVRVEGVRSYNSSTFANSISGLVSDTTSFYNANPDAGAYINTQDGVVAQVLPYIEVRSSGNLTSSSDQNLRTFFGVQQAGKGGTLALRSSGDLVLNGSLSDGFSTATATGLLQPNAKTFSFNLIAGADLTAANQMATVEGVGDFSLATGKLIRTGEGDISIAAGRNISLDTNANIYTLGKTVPNIAGFTPPRAATSPRDRNFYNVNGSYVNNGGDITLNAGNDITGVLSGQSVNEWLSRQGSATADTSWWIRADLFNQGVATLAGGDVNIRAGNNISNLSVSSATNAQYDTAGAGATGNAVVNGGGDLNIQAGGDLTNGIYYSGRGAINIRVDGDIEKTGNTGTAIALQDAQADVRAKGNALIETVYNPTLWMQNSSVTTGNSLTFFSTYTDQSAFSVSSLLGNLTIGQNNPGSLNSGLLFNDADNSLDAVIKNDMAAIHPGQVKTTAFTGGLTVNKVIVTPSKEGELVMLASKDIVGPVSSGGRDKPVAQILVSNADTASNLSIDNPFSGKPSDNLELFGDIKYGNQLTSVNTGTSNSVVIVSKEGSIDLPGDPPATLSAEADGSGVYGLKSSMPAYISAANNLTLNASIQHNNQGDISFIKAGNDILMKVNQPLARIEVNGPGDLIVQAGRNIDLGNSAGILSRANNVNPNLASNGANITVLAGLGESDAAVRDFVTQYIDPRGAGPTPLSAKKDAQDAKNEINEKSATYRTVLNKSVQNYMQKRTGNALTETEAMQLFLALDVDKQKPLVFDLFRVELTNAIVDYVQTANTTRGDEVIAALFPIQNSYKGNISMYQSQIVSAREGNINLLLPGGVLNAGVAADSVNLPHGIGIITERGGYINVYAENGFEVNQSKVKTLFGGDLIAWVNNGDIDAGRGSKTAISVPERLGDLDSFGNRLVELKGVASGSGLATDTYDPDGPNGNQREPKAGTVYLAAPRGALDAGEAGVASGSDLFIGAAVINNATNITAAGSSSGVPVADAGSLAGSLAGLPDTAAGVTSAMTENLNSQLPSQNVVPKTLPPIVSVKTIRLED